jgi:uncharacterized protein
MIMTREHILRQARTYVQAELARDSSGHDWWHIYRVTELAKRIGAAEKADLFVCELAALLHDIADEKLNASAEAGLDKVKNWLEAHAVPDAEREHVMEIIGTISFKGGNNKPVRTLEACVVQDADRLDAIGAMGIARVFAYAGWKGHLMHDPAQAPRTELSPEAYRNGQNTAINHFYEKLLKLKDLMNTHTARQLAEDRHRFMEMYLEQFYREWEGER